MQTFIPLYDKFCTNLFEEGFICDDKLTIDKNSSLFYHFFEKS
jgi:hypothetical protein